MLYENNYIEKLLGIKGVILKNIEENDNILMASKILIGLETEFFML